MRGSRSSPRTPPSLRRERSPSSVSSATAAAPVAPLTAASTPRDRVRSHSPAVSSSTAATNASKPPVFSSVAAQYSTSNGATASPWRAPDGATSQQHQQHQHHLRLRNRTFLDLLSECCDRVSAAQSTPASSEGVAGAAPPAQMRLLRLRTFADVDAFLFPSAAVAAAASVAAYSSVSPSPVSARRRCDPVAVGTPTKRVERQPLERRFSPAASYAERQRRLTGVH